MFFLSWLFLTFLSLSDLRLFYNSPLLRSRLVFNSTTSRISLHLVFDSITSFSSMDIVFTEGPVNLNWTQIMKTINEDPQAFFQEGGWTFLQPESDGEAESDAEESDFQASSESEEEYDESGSDAASVSASGSEDEEEMSEEGEDEESDGDRKRKGGDEGSDRKKIKIR